MHKKFYFFLMLFFVYALHGLLACLVPCSVAWLVPCHCWTMLEYARLCPHYAITGSGRFIKYFIKDVNKHAIKANK